MQGERREVSAKEPARRADEMAKMFIDALAGLTPDERIDVLAGLTPDEREDRLRAFEEATGQLERTPAD